MNISLVPFLYWKHLSLFTEDERHKSKKILRWLSYALYNLHAQRCQTYAAYDSKWGYHLSLLESRHVLLPMRLLSTFLREHTCAHLPRIVSGFNHLKYVQSTQNWVNVCTNRQFSQRNTCRMFCGVTRARLRRFPVPSKQNHSRQPIDPHDQQVSSHHMAHHKCISYAGIRSTYLLVW